MTQQASDPTRPARQSRELGDLTVRRDAPFRYQRDDLPDLLGDAGFVGFVLSHISFRISAVRLFPWAVQSSRSLLKLRSQPAYSGLARMHPSKDMS